MRSELHGADVVAAVSTGAIPKDLDNLLPVHRLAELRDMTGEERRNCLEYSVLLSAQDFDMDSEWIEANLQGISD